MVIARVLAVIALALWARSAALFSRDASVSLRKAVNPGELLVVAREAVTLRWMEGGGEGCYYPEPEQASDTRRLLHTLVVVGFIFANVSTVLAAAYQHLLALTPPYPVTSAPVLFGIAGGIGMIVGTSGLLYLKAGSARGLISKQMLQMDWAFLVVFDLVSITGMLTLILRETPLMSAMLLLHLAALGGLFVTVPYGKFTHMLYRLVALLQNRRDLKAEDVAAHG